MKLPPIGIGCWVSCGTPSYLFSSRSPCQCTVVSRSPSLVTLNDDLGSLLDAEGGAGDRAVVAEHPNGAVAKPLGYGSNVKVKRVAVGELQDLGCRGLGEACGIGRE